MSNIQFCELRENTKEVVIDVVKKRLQSLNCDVNLKKLRKEDPQFNRLSLDHSINTRSNRQSCLNNVLPFWVTYLCENIESQIDCEGLFRKNASDVKIHEMKESLTSSQRVEVTGIEAAGLLKTFLREMNPQLFSTCFTKLLLYIWQTYTKESVRDVLVLDALLLLPLSYIKLCKRIFHCFNFVARNCELNKMTVHNVAVCVSMSLFSPPTTQITSTNALNELTAFLISSCYKIDIITDEVHSLTIKSLASHKEKITMSEKIKRKATSKTRRGLRCPSPNSKTESDLQTPSSKVRTGRKLNFDNDPDKFATTTPLEEKAILSVKRSEGLLKLSPNATSFNLAKRTTRNTQIGNFDRRASFSNSEKPELPRSVSSVRKRKLQIDECTGSPLCDDFYDNTYNASKLNFVVFDSTPEQRSDSGSEAESPSASRGNAPLMLDAASAARATRHRLEQMNQSKIINKENIKTKVHSDKMNTTFIIQTPQTSLSPATKTCPSTSTVKEVTIMQSNFNLVSSTPKLKACKPICSVTPNNAIEASSCTISPNNYLASTPKLTMSKAKNNLHRSVLCSITEDIIQRNFTFSSIKNEKTNDGALVENMTDSKVQQFSDLDSLVESDVSEVFMGSFPGFDNSANQLPVDEDDRRISLCLASDTHKSNFKNLKQRWESTN